MRPRSWEHFINQRTRDGAGCYDGLGRQFGDVTNSIRM